MKNQYDEGFLNGVAWCARCLRLAALKIERPVMDQFENKERGIVVTAVAKSGRFHLAHVLRENATALEEEMRKEYAKSEQPPVERVHETSPDGGQQKR